MVFSSNAPVFNFCAFSNAFKEFGCSGSTAPDPAVKDEGALHNSLGCVKGKRNVQIASFVTNRKNLVRVLILWSGIKHNTTYTST
jgi:hypothetical protein